MSESRVAIRPRYGEVDRMGVVYHANYLLYFDIGRTDYLRQRGIPYAEVEERGYLLSVVDVGVKYKRSARYDEDLELVTRLARFTKATVLFEYELFGPDGRLLTTGFTKLACLDKRDNRPTMLPADLRALLERSATEGGGTPGGPSGSSPGRKAARAPSETA